MSWAFTGLEVAARVTAAIAPVVPTASRQAPAPASSRRRDRRGRGLDISVDGSGFMAPPKPSGPMSTYQPDVIQARRPLARQQTAPACQTRATGSPGLKSRD